MTIFAIEGDLLKLLDVSASEVVLKTTFGSLKPPLGKHRLKVLLFQQNIYLPSFIIERLKCNMSSLDCCDSFFIDRICFMFFREVDY